MVYDVQANLTLALVVMDVSTAEELATNVEKSKSAAYNPTLIPLLVLEEETQNALVKQLRFSKQSSETARNIGLNPWSRADNDTDQQKDLLSLSTELTKVAQQIAQSKERCHNTLRAIEKTAEMHVHYTQICESKRLPLDDPVMSDANARMDCVLELALGLVRRAERCQEDIQANIQTVRLPYRILTLEIYSQLLYRCTAWCPTEIAGSTIKLPRRLLNWLRLPVETAPICES